MVQAEFIAVKIKDKIQAAFYRRFYRWLRRRPWNIAIPDGAVSITFDDFPISAAQTANRILVRNGWRGTYYLAPGLLGVHTSVGMVISEHDIGHLLSEGHEIGNHTFSHADCTRISRKVLANELTLSEKFLKLHGGVKQFAFPFGAYNCWSASYLGGRFRTMRTTQPGVNAGVTDLNLLKANRLYSPVDDEKVNQLIETVKAQSGWLIFYTHDVSKTPSQFGCSVEEFERLMQKLKEANLSVSSMSEVCDLLKIR